MSRPQQQSGYIIILALITVVALSSIGLSIMSVVSSKYASPRRNNYLNSAVYTAEAGISDTIQQLNGNSAFVGYSSGTPKLFFDHGQDGSAYYSTTVTTNADTTKTINAVGTVYRYPGDTTPFVKQLQATVQQSLSTLQYSGIAGPGGMVVDHAKVVGVVNLSIMGQLTVSNASTAVGTADTSGDAASNPAITTYIANVGCGSGSAYPSACGTGSYVASLTGGGHIYGTVCATTNNIFADGNPGSGIFPGNGSGLLPGCIAPVASPPPIDKTAFTNKMSTTLLGALGQCSGGGSNVTWNKNTKYTGNITASNCTITVKGDVYITGNLTTKNGTMTIKVDDSAGTITPTIIANGTVSLDQTNITPNSFGTGAKIVSFNSSKSSCSTDDSCNLLTGSDLLSSVALTTATATRNSNLNGSTLWAYFGGLVIDQSSISGAIGQKISLTGSSTMTPSANGTSTGMSTTIWKIADYQQVYP